MMKRANQRQLRPRTGGLNRQRDGLRRTGGLED